MDVKLTEKIDMSTYGVTTSCSVNILHVKILSVKSRAQEIIKAIIDKSWIAKLDAVSSRSYESRATKTIAKLVDNIINKVGDVVTEEFGEYLVSDTAGNVLAKVYNHSKVPLAELWKEQMTGNPGFDFHTESESQLIVFGEAKFKSDGNPYAVALTQIVDFVVEKKDDMELVDLKNFVSKEAVQNALDNKKAFVAAFSLNATKPALIFRNALSHEKFKELMCHSEIYLIGVEV